jgi:nucleoside-triphosphatase
VEPNLLITGLPGIGNPTFVIKLVDRLSDARIAAFYMKEIRAGGARQGFEIVDIGTGSCTLLSHIDFCKGQRVGKYGVDVKGFEDYLETAPFFLPDTQLVLIDEISKMECLSGKFTRLIVDLLNAPIMLVATIALYGSGIIQEIRHRADAHLHFISQETRDSLIGQIEIAVRGRLIRQD